MDNAVIEAPAPNQLSAEVAERVLASGDIKELSAAQRVEYVIRFCDSLGLNPLTRPVRFLLLNGSVQLYFTRDGTDQLRRIHNISLAVIEQRTDAGIFQVRVKAVMPNGRHDEDIGAVTLPQSGESRANALMKCITKAKRRVTLSIVGLGFLSEDELDTIPGARTFAVDEEVPPEGKHEGPKTTDTYVAGEPLPPSPQRSEAAWRVWLDKLREAMRGLDVNARAEFSERPTIKQSIKDGPPWVASEAIAMITNGVDPNDLPPIKGEENVRAG